MRVRLREPPAPGPALPGGLGSKGAHREPWSEPGQPPPNHPFAPRNILRGAPEAASTQQGLWGGKSSWEKLPGGEGSLHRLAYHSHHQHHQQHHHPAQHLHHHHHRPQPQDLPMTARPAAGPVPAEARRTRRGRASMADLGRSAACGRAGTGTGTGCHRLLSPSLRP